MPHSDNSAIEPHARVAAAIRTLLRQGFMLGAEARRQLESAMAGSFALADLAALLADEEHPERAWLLELLFYPDEAIQIALEPLLASLEQGLDPSRVQRLLQVARPLTTSLRFDDGSGSIELTLPDEALAPLLARLHLERRIDPGLAAACASLPAALAQAVRVRLRNLPGELHGQALSFLARLIAELLPRTPAELPELEFLLEVATGEARPAQDMYAALTLRKRRIAFAQEQVRSLSARRQRTGLEWMLQQGMRIPCVDPEACVRQIEIIDRACLALFGRTEPLPLLERQELQLDAGDPANLLRWLDSSA